MIRRTLGAAAALAWLVPSLASAEVGEGNFSLQSTRDLYELCSAPSDHADYAPAIYACRSFIEATVQYHDAVSDGNAYLVGDAVGLATRDMCEGIGPAVESGLRAARAIGEGMDYALADIAPLSGNSFVCLYPANGQYPFP